MCQWSGKGQHSLTLHFNVTTAFWYKHAEHVHTVTIPLCNSREKRKCCSKCFKLFSSDYFMSSFVAPLKTISNLARQRIHEKFQTGLDRACTACMRSQFIQRKSYYGPPSERIGLLAYVNISS